MTAISFVPGKIGPRRSSLSTCLVVVIAVLLPLSLPATSKAETAPQITSFTANPSQVKVGESTMISAGISEINGEWDVEIVNTETGEQVTRCRASFSSCNTKISIPWSENRAPKDLHLAAFIVPDSEPPAGEVSKVALTVPVERFEWNISLEATQNPIAIGEETWVSVTGLEPTPAWTGYETSIINESTGELVTSCFGAQCGAQLKFPYSMENEAGPIRLHAEISYEGEPTNIAGSADLTLFVEPIRFKVDLSFAEPETNSEGEPTWLATASGYLPLSVWSGFTVWITRSDGSVVTGCVMSEGICSSRVGPGTYQAIVTGNETLYAATPWWTVGSAGGAEPAEDSVDDLSLLTLTGMYQSPSEICTDLLGYPGTHFEGGSVSDQYLACEEAVAGGNSTAEVLRAVAAAGGGTSVLWFLYEEETKERTPQEDTEPTSGAEPAPPAPPIGWPGDLDGEARKLRELNPALESEREARVVTKECLRLVFRASLPSEDCTKLPIFASGDLDVPEATEHDREALEYHPGWVKLNYEQSAGRSGREWYRRAPVCKVIGEGLHCDEFPFFSTEQGGGEASPLPSLKQIGETQNVRQGSRLSWFYRKCGVNVGEGKPFLNVPTPAGSNLPTLPLCNGSS
jgi:hypothetical protein